MKQLTTNQMLKVEGGRIGGSGASCGCGTVSGGVHGGTSGIGRMFTYVVHILFH